MAYGIYRTRHYATFFRLLIDISILLRHLMLRLRYADFRRADITPPLLLIDAKITISLPPPALMLLPCRCLTLLLMPPRPLRYVIITITRRYRRAAATCLPRAMLCRHDITKNTILHAYADYGRLLPIKTPARYAAPWLL